MSTTATPAATAERIAKVAEETGVSPEAVAAAAELEGASTLAQIRKAVADHAASSGAEPDEADRPEPTEPTPEEGGQPESGPSHDTRGDEAAATRRLGFLLAQRIGDASASKAIAQAEITPEAVEASASDDQLARLQGQAPKGLRGAALGVWLLTGESPARKASAASIANANRRAAAATREPGERGPREGSTLHAVLTVLRRARGPLKPSEVYDRIKEGNLAPGLKGKTPEATVAAQMAVAAAKGKHGIYRPEPGRYAVRKES